MTYDWIFLALINYIYFHISVVNGSVWLKLKPGDYSLLHYIIKTHAGHRSINKSLTVLPFVLF